MEEMALLPRHDLMQRSTPMVISSSEKSSNTCCQRNDFTLSTEIVIKSSLYQWKKELRRGATPLNYGRYRLFNDNFLSFVTLGLDYELTFDGINDFHTLEVEVADGSVLVHLYVVDT